MKQIDNQIYSGIRKEIYKQIDDEIKNSIEFSQRNKK